MALATYEDSLVYTDDIRTEVLAGEIVFPPSPLVVHQYVRGTLSCLLAPFSDRHTPGGWWLLPAVDVRFAVHDVPCPDFSGWHREDWPVPFGVRPIDLIPDFICEILDPGHDRQDRGYKADLYAAHGVAHLWFIDPSERFLEAFELSAGRWLRLGMYDETATARIPPFAAVELDLAELFPPADAIPR